MKNMEKVIEILEQQVINKTLNLDGISQVQKIIDENKKLIEENNTTKSLLKKSTDKEDELRDDLSKTQKKLLEAIKKIEEYEVRDKQFYEQSIKFEYEQKRGNELKEIVGMALRNPIITSNRFGNTVVSDASGYPVSVPINDSETKTIE